MKNEHHFNWVNCLCCQSCRKAVGAHEVRMIVCKTCGNKRCPKAENHKFRCTGSNATGQVGETEEAFRQRLKEAGDRASEIVSSWPAWKRGTTTQEPSAQAERILCAAIWYQDGHVHEQQPVETGYVACGHRHCNIHTQPRAERLMPSVQGFLTSNGEFASRRVALRIARAAGQLEGRTKHPPLDQLLSEDLY